VNRPVDVAVAVIQDRGRLFLQRRPEAAAAFPGLWELPGDKLEAGETALAAVRRELLEELSWAPDLATPLEPLGYAYPGLSVRLHPFLCAGAAQPRTRLAWGWFTIREALRLPLPEATRKLLAQAPWVFPGRADGVAWA
jgi:8-oxo-dGTP diphosphatase